MERLAQRLADAIATAGDHHNLTRHLHGHPPGILISAHDPEAGLMLNEERS